MSPRPDVSEARKDQILDAATEIFNQKGFQQARMDDIAEESQLSKGALYWYFKSKDEIIIAILDRLFQHEFKDLEKLRAERLSATESLWIFTERVIQDMNRMLGMIPIAYEFIALAFRSRVVQEAMRRYFNRYLTILVPLIERGIENGEFRAVDPTEVALAAGAIFEGTVLLWVYDRSLVVPERHIRSGIKLLLEGLEPRSAQKSSANG